MYSGVDPNQSINQSDCQSPLAVEFGTLFSVCRLPNWCMDVVTRQKFLLPSQVGIYRGVKEKIIRWQEDSTVFVLVQGYILLKNRIFLPLPLFKNYILPQSRVRYSDPYHIGLPDPDSNKLAKIIGMETHLNSKKKSQEHHIFVQRT